MNEEALVQTLVALEICLMSPEADKAARLLAEDFVEFGASGRVYDRAGTLAALADMGARAKVVEISDFAVRRLGADLVLATYRVASPASLRASLWRLTDEGWRILFHQGTPAAPG